MQLSFLFASWYKKKGISWLHLLFWIKVRWERKSFIKFCTAVQIKYSLLTEFQQTTG